MSESVQSQLNNFVLQFFGTVTKTEVAPETVVWGLPCNLDSGLPESPRGVSEGVACYFFRLMREEIARFAGPQGPVGEPGFNGYPAYTALLSGYTQPDNATPFEIRTIYNPCIVEQQLVYIDGSGYFQVLWVDDATGKITVSMIQPMLGAPSMITPGRRIIPVGPKGADQTGPVGNTGQVGDRGPDGEQGPPGPDGADGVTLLHGPTEMNGFFIGKYGMTPFQVKGSQPDAQLVAFGTTDAAKVKFSLIVAGKYLFKISSSCHTTDTDAVLYCGLYDVTTVASNVSPDPAGTNKFLPGSYFNLYPHGAGLTLPVTQCCIVETMANYSTIEWRAFGQRCRITPELTTVTWVRLT